MKKMLSTLSDSVLSREQMKNVKGGQLQNCAVCSTWPGSGVFNCGGYIFPEDEAEAMADEFNNTLNDGYIYTWSC